MAISWVGQQLAAAPDRAHCAYHDLTTAMGNLRQLSHQPSAQAARQRNPVFVILAGFLMARALGWLILLIMTLAELEASSGS